MHLVRNSVREELDLGAILSTYTEARGFPPYHPGMMVALLLYTYSHGVYSSRRIARGCEEQLDFHAVTVSTADEFAPKVANEISPLRYGSVATVSAWRLDVGEVG